jgi:hypothetical protein
VAWSPEARLRQVAGAFPHPALPERVVAVASAGLFLSLDAGRSWRALPQAASDRVGPIRHVAFDPRGAETFYIASDTQGVWVTRDGGKTFLAIGTKRTGMASDAVVGIYLYPADMRYLTLLAVHGDAAPGISLTEDGGHTWRVVSPDYHAWKLLCTGHGSHRLYMAASKKEAADVQGVWCCVSLGQPWYVVLRDVVPTDAALGVLKGGVYWLTSDSGLYQITHSGADYERAGPEDAPRWASIGVAWGHHADAQILYAYEPTKLGMAVSTDGMKTWSTHRSGLPLSPFVREGAHIRANANGTAFFAVANGLLCTGYRVDGALTVSHVAVEPPALAFAPGAYHEGMWRIRRSLALLPRERYAADGARKLAACARRVENALSHTEATVTARVVARGATPKSVTVDLSRLGGSCRSPLLDDGQHGDGAAGDGVFGARFPIHAKGLERDGYDWRRPWPGRLGLTVTAVAHDGKLTGTVGVLFIHSPPASFPYWSEDSRVSTRDRRGAVSFTIAEDPVSPYLSAHSWQLTAGPGDWVIPFGDPWHLQNLTGFHAMSFWIKSDGKGDGRIFVQLRDSPTYIYPTTTPRVDFVAERLIDGGAITAEFRRVVIPLSRFLAEAPNFHKHLFCWLVLSGDGPSARSYWIDDIRFFQSREALEADVRQIRP